MLILGVEDQGRAEVDRKVCTEDCAISSVRRLFFPWGGKKKTI